MLADGVVVIVWTVRNIIWNFVCTYVYDISWGEVCIDMYIFFYFMLFYFSYLVLSCLVPYRASLAPWYSCYHTSSRLVSFRIVRWLHSIMDRLGCVLFSRIYVHVHVDVDFHCYFALLKWYLLDFTTPHPFPPTTTSFKTITSYHPHPTSHLPTNNPYSNTTTHTTESYQNSSTSHPYYSSHWPTPSCSQPNTSPPQQRRNSSHIRPPTYYS